MDIPEIPNGNGRFLSKGWMIGVLITVVLMLLSGVAKVAADRLATLENQVSIHTDQLGGLREGQQDLRLGQERIEHKVDRLLERASRQ